MLCGKFPPPCGRSLWRWIKLKTVWMLFDKDSGASVELIDPQPSIWNWAVPSHLSVFPLDDKEFPRTFEDVIRWCGITGDGFETV